MKTPKWFLKKSPIALALIPVSWVYYIFSRLVYMFRRGGALKSRRKIICVGNILAGGVGKTPIVKQIAQYFDAPVVMRGYKKDKSVSVIGDEATMLARAGLAVHVGDRKSNIILLNNQNDEIGPIVMDDGLQNPTIKKDVEIVVFDEAIGYGNGLLLPAGPLRDVKRSVKKADAVIVIRAKNSKKKLKLPNNIPVFCADNKTISPYDENQKLVAFAGIGYPGKFFAALDNVVDTRAFEDHYQYTKEDIEKLISLANKKGARLITTEKDWVRLPAEYQEEIKYAKLETVIENVFWDWIKEKI